MITLLQLDYFRKLAATEHITKTAQELHISQTALSSMIINLEKELGVQLFDRSKRTIRINEAGRIYLKYINDVFTALDNGRAAVQEISSNKEQAIHIAAGSSSIWLSLFHDFCQKHLKYTLKQSNYTVSQLETALQEATVDFVIAGEDDLSAENMKKTWFKKDTVYICVSPTHPMADLEFVYMEDLKNESFISLNADSPWRSYCNRLFKQAGYTPNIVLECNYTLRAALIESNFGVALTSGSAQEKDFLKPNKYIRIADDYATRNMYLYRNPNRYLSSAAKDFLEFCVNYYKTDT